MTIMFRTRGEKPAVAGCFKTGDCVQVVVVKTPHAQPIAKGTIEPNVGRAFAPAPCPCAVAGLSDVCEPSHGRESVGGVHCRRIPVFVKDVAGLVPGAHAGLVRAWVDRSERAGGS